MNRQASWSVIDLPVVPLSITRHDRQVHRSWDHPQLLVMRPRWANAQAHILVWGAFIIMQRFTHTVCGAPRLREEVYPVCSEPLIPSERGGLPSVQWALHPSWERRFTQCAVGPSSFLREEVDPVCCGPFIPPERGGLPSVQWALHPSWEMRFSQCAVGPLSLLREEVSRVCSGPLIPPERGGLPSVQWAPHPSWERRFT